jgi:hypothetical protein
LGTGARITLATAAISLAFLMAAGLAYELRGTEGVAAAGVAAMICWLGAIAAVPVSSLFRGPAAVTYGVGLAMFARMALPLAVGVTLHALVPRLAEAGMIYYLLAFYFLALALDTTLAVAQIPRSGSRAQSI